jgi:hypothetical protein
MNKKNNSKVKTENNIIKKKKIKKSKKKTFIKKEKIHNNQDKIKTPKTNFILTIIIIGVLLIILLLSFYFNDNYHKNNIINPESKILSPEKITRTVENEENKYIETIYNDLDFDITCTLHFRIISEENISFFYENKTNVIKSKKENKLIIYYPDYEKVEYMGSYTICNSPYSGCDTYIE